MYNWQSASRRLLQETVVFLASSPASSDDVGDDQQNDNINAFDVDRTFSPFMAVILVLLLSAFFFMAFFSIYIRRSASQQANAPPRTADGNENGSQGVDAAVLEALPLIAYSSAKKRGSSIECAVCLADFEEGEPLCQLPRCKHVFHKSCIKMWLSSHTTCPLCRRSVISDSTRSFRWGVDSGSLRLSLGAWGSRQRSGRSLTGEPSSAPAGQELQPSMAEHDRIKSDRFPRSHSTGHSIVGQSQSVAWRAAMAEPEQSLDVAAIGRILQESSADASLQRSRSFAASADGRWAQLRIGGWVREAGASLKRVLSVKKMGSAAAFGPAASSAAACNPISPV